VEIDENIVAAVNAALDDLAAKQRELRAEAGVDLPAIRETLRELRERNLARFGVYIEGARAFTASIGRQR
jgi:DNA-binding Lrp family transcriptional regulator